MTTKAKSSIAALALLATLGLGASSVAHAGGDDVFWSIAMSQPGIQVGVSNAPPAPILVHESYHMHPRPVYVPPPRVVYLPPQPVYRGYYGHGHGHGWGHRGWEGRNDRWEDRRERHGGHDRDDRGQRYGHNDGDRGQGHGGRGPDMHIGRR